MKKQIAVLLVLCLLPAVCACDRFSRRTRQAFAFDTVINITANESDSQYVTEALSECSRFENIFSRTNEDSELYAVNNKKATSISDELREVLEFSLQFSKMTNGAFDITVAPLVELWNVNERTVPPTHKEIESALSAVGSQKVSLSPLDIGDSSIDLGAVAKGYIADKLIERFRQEGVTDVIVDLGGNVALIGEYTVGIRDPFNPEDVFATIRIKDKSAVSSGAYQRYFEYKGKRYHHIIDPRNGYCADSEIASVTVISPLSMHADALSTAIYILGEDALSLCDEFADTDALIITNDGDVITTENFDKKYDLNIN